MQARIPVRVIPAKPTIAPMYLLPPDMLRRTAAYARVSTDSEEQDTSYDTQVDYYTKYIQSREDWIFVGIYTDAETPYGRNPKSPLRHVF